MEVPRHWRLNQQRYALTGAECPRCSARMISERAVCPHCGHPLAENTLRIPLMSIKLGQTVSVSNPVGGGD